METVSLTSFRT